MNTGETDIQNEADGSDRAAAATGQRAGRGPTPDATDFGFVQSLLTTGTELTGRLAAVLARERHALVNREMDQLRDVLVEKDQIVGLLGNIERSRDALLDDAFAQPHFSASQREHLTDLQHDFKRQVGACRDQNLVNGRLVQRARQSVTEVLQVVTGTGPAETYTASGTTDGLGTGRSIGKA